MITEMLGLDSVFLNVDNIFLLLLRLSINLFFTSIVVFLIYVRRYGKSEYVFTYVMFNLITFILCFQLRQVPIELGFALGLFAVFGILRYRTESIRINELTYLFVVIGIGILNAVVNDKISLGELLIVNTLIAGLAAFLVHFFLGCNDLQLRVIYDDLQVLRTKGETALISDLSTRTGLEIVKIEIVKIDLLRDVAEIQIFYRKNQSSS